MISGVSKNRSLIVYRQMIFYLHAKRVSPRTRMKASIVLYGRAAQNVYCVVNIDLGLQYVMSPHNSMMVEVEGKKLLKTLKLDVGFMSLTSFS